MANQLSIFDKQRHHSHKDFTCSIGKHDVVYITFRNESWKRFTACEYITVVVKDGVLCFGSPAKYPSASPFKLKQNAKGYKSTVERTRYIQIEGKKHPAILEVVRQKAGSYDFPKEQKKEEPRTEDKRIIPKSASEEARAMLDFYLARAQSPEERVEVFRTFGPMLAPHQIPRPAPDKWEIP